MTALNKQKKHMAVYMDIDSKNITLVMSSHSQLLEVRGMIQFEVACVFVNDEDDTEQMRGRKKIS